MTLCILHNPLDAESRAFVEAALADNPADVEVLDWYDETARARWVEAGGTLRVSAFPSVVYDGPEYEEELAAPDGTPIRVTFPAELVVDRLPRDLTEARARAEKRRAAAAVTMAERAKRNAQPVAEPKAVAVERTQDAKALGADVIPLEQRLAKL